MRAFPENSNGNPKGSQDWRVRVNWLDAVGLIFGWIGLLDDSLSVMCAGALIFAGTRGRFGLSGGCGASIILGFRDL